MAKQKTSFACNACGASAPKWSGQCGDCGEWNTLAEVVAIDSSRLNRLKGYAGSAAFEIFDLEKVPAQVQMRQETGLSELDRVLGGGLVAGSVILLGGDPGIGKSTVLLQTLAKLSAHTKTLYITGEESLQQVSLRASRLGLHAPNMRLLASTQVEHIIEAARRESPSVMVVDSIQTIYTEQLNSAPGAVGQLRESTALLAQYAKQTQTTIFLVGHVTKEGTLAGPRVLEHIVDTVLYFEGQSDNRFRVIRAVKNRFGAVNELGIFAMSDKGLQQVANPSAIFLSRSQEPVSGSAVMVSWEGSRPLLVEVQALVDQSHLGNPRRVTVGLDGNRLTMILAILHRHGGIASYDQDVFINVVGGVRVIETGIDMAVALAVLSSLRNKPLPLDVVVFGEVGLAGEVRPVQSGHERIREAAKHGFKRAIVPAANVKNASFKEIEVIPIERLEQVLDFV
jgi:DNA repair protein RadA/Sms